MSNAGFLRYDQLPDVRQQWQRYGQERAAVRAQYDADWAEVDRGNMSLAEARARRDAAQADAWARYSNAWESALVKHRQDLARER